MLYNFCIVTSIKHQIEYIISSICASFAFFQWFRKNVFKLLLEFLAVVKRASDDFRTLYTVLARKNQASQLRFLSIDLDFATFRLHTITVRVLLSWTCSTVRFLCKQSVYFQEEQAIVNHTAKYFTHWGNGDVWGCPDFVTNKPYLMYCVTFACKRLVRYF